MMKDQEWREITSLNSSLLHKMNLSMVLLENKITSWKRGVMDLCISLSCCPSYQRNCQVDNLLKLRQKVIDHKNLLRRRQYKLWKPFGKVEPIWVGHSLRLWKSPELFIHFAQTQLLFCVVCFCVRWSLISNCTNDLFCIMCPLGVLQCLPQKIYLTSLFPNSV